MKTILLVDDDQQLRRTLVLGSAQKRLLRQSKQIPESQPSKLRGKHLPDLIVSDIDMPGGERRISAS
jgi:CheY-like chemotaxis protein